MNRSYSSNKRYYLVETRLAHRQCVFNLKAKDLESMEGNQWFYVSSDGKANFLGNDWQFVDAADYDADGKSEIIFYVVCR